MDTKLVIVYILSGQPTAAKVEPIGYLFQDPLFEPKVITIDENAKNMAKGPEVAKAQENVAAQEKVEQALTKAQEKVFAESLSLKHKRDAHRYRFCLEDAKKNHPNNPFIIVKDSSKSNADPERVADVVSAALTKKDWDICYLCNWGDECSNFSDKKKITGTMTTLAKTQSPNGLQATMMTPKARDVLLDTFVDKALPQKVTDLVKNGKLSAITTVPNLLEYDILEAKDDDDYRRTHTCVTNEKSMFESSGWTWLIFLLIILVIVALFVLYNKRKMF